MRMRARMSRCPALAALGSGIAGRRARLRLGPNLVAVGELTREETRTEADSLYHKNLLPVTYVTGDLAGAAESPVYAILRMNSVISNVTLPEVLVRDLQHASAVRHDEVHHEVGRRMAHHV